jgi:hypothetical protein
MKSFMAASVAFAPGPVNAQDGRVFGHEFLEAELARESSCAVIPALDAAETVGAVVRDLLGVAPELEGRIFVVDDGSRDGTAAVARDAGARVVRHAENRGKGAALRTGFEAALAAGATVALTLDADGQHPASSARATLHAARDPDVLVLAVRDLAGAGAPRKNQFSNGVSNFFLSRFAGRPLADTQCGLRRYPLRATLALGARASGYAYEAEVLFRAARAGWPIVETCVPVLYPPERTTHFDARIDVPRIIVRVLATAFELARAPSPPSPRPSVGRPWHAP